MRHYKYILFKLLKSLTHSAQRNGSVQGQCEGTEGAVNSNPGCGGKRMLCDPRQKVFVKSLFCLQSNNPNNKVVAGIKVM